MYRPHCDLQKKEIERIQKEENMSLPQDIDYFSLPVSLSQEVREILDRVRPSTVSLHIQSVVVSTVCSNNAADTILYPPAGCCYTFARHNSSRSRLSL